MNFRNFKSIRTLLMLAAAIGSATVVPGVAQAGELFNGWNYSIDSFNDGTEYSTIGDKSAFEFYGLAFREYEDKVVFAVNSNLSLDGWKHRNAMNGSVGYGDLFINFSDTSSFDNANRNGDLYGVRFAESNDTSDRRVGGLGLYENVTSRSLTTRNMGYGSMQSHTNTVKRLGGEASYGDLDADTAYFDSSKAAATHIKSGDYASDITLMDSFDSDLDFGKFGAVGQYTFGFSMDKSKLQVGNFVAHLFAECGNDGIVIDGEIIGNLTSAQPVPESSPMAGLAVVGMVGGALALRKRQQAKLEV